MSLGVVYMSTLANVEYSMGSQIATISHINTEEVINS